MILQKILTFVATSAAIYLCIALGLILSQRPGSSAQSAGGLDFSKQVTNSGPEPVGLTDFATKDGAGQVARVYPGPADGPLLVLVHGSGWHGLQFDALAQYLQNVATIVVPDLRGHGENPARRGDVDYIGQLEDDLADLIKVTAKPGQKVILGGHSSGGGLVVRFAGGAHRDLIDSVVLMSPFLKYNAPTTRPNSGGWATPLMRRIIGLSMLNNVGITWLNHLTAIQFNFPEIVLNGPLGHTATSAYSFRLNTSFAPRGKYLADIARLPEFVLIAGTADESFVAEGYEPLMSEVTDKGSYVLVKDVSHLAIVDAPETAAAIRDFLK